MKKIIPVIAFSVLCTSLFSQLHCNPALWPHVYNPERLQGEKKCTTVKGMVWEVKAEPDGGYRLLIKLDLGQPTTLLNDKNVSLTKGCLVAQIICAHRPITDADALKSCGTFENQIKVPKLNDHVQLTGTYMLDSDPEHGWYALYPVSDVIELQKR